MWCPFCNHESTRVVDSRLTRDGMQIRRRRQCERCAARFNTYEAPEIKAPRIIKADGTREADEKLHAALAEVDRHPRCPAPAPRDPARTGLRNLVRTNPPCRGLSMVIASP